MPRRKKAFIDRSKSRTYEVVYRPLADRSGGPDRVLRPVARGNASAASYAEAGADDDEYCYREVSDALEESYDANRQSFALGEFGFPDDGYDYSKHFKTIGSAMGTAVFVASHGQETPNPGSSVSDASSLKDPTGLKFSTMEDERRRSQALLSIANDRQQDPDLDEVIAALESSSGSELDAEEEDWVESEEDDRATHEESNPYQPDGAKYSSGDAVPCASSDANDELEDDFVAHANRVSDEEHPDVPRGTTGEHRHCRHLDRKFDAFMKSYWEENESSNGLSDNPSTDSGEQFSDSEAESNENPIPEGSEIDEALLRVIAHDLPEGLARADNDIDMAMEALTGQYKRITVEEMYTLPDAVRAPEAVEGARRAERRRFVEGRVSSDEADDNSTCFPVGLASSMVRPSVSNDEATDDEWEEVAVVSRNHTQWDCETILSTYSNLDNHPSVINAGPGSGRQPSKLKRREPIIRLDPRTRAPVDYLPNRRQNVSKDKLVVVDEESDFNRTSGKDACAVHIRPKEESREDKRSRKAAVKVAAKVRRVEKSEMRKAFADEKTKQGNHSTRLGKSKVSVRF